MPSTLQIMPTAFKKCFLTFVGANTLVEPAALTGTYYTYRLNSVYDPDFTGVGSSAIGFGSLATMYGLFRVMRARVVLKYYLNTTTAPSVVGFLPGLNSTYTSDLLKWEAQPFATSKIIQGAAGGQHSIVTFDKTYDLAQLAGITKEQYRTDFDFAHSNASNPVKSLFGTVYMRGLAGAAQTVSCIIRISYELEVSQPLQTLTS